MADIAFVPPESTVQFLGAARDLAFQRRIRFGSCERRVPGIPSPYPL
jgi:hypothetical protein